MIASPARPTRSLRPVRCSDLAWPMACLMTDRRGIARLWPGPYRVCIPPLPARWIDLEAVFFCRVQERIQFAKGRVIDRPVTQSWVDSSAFVSSPPRGPANPVSALGPRLRGGRG